MQPHHSQTIADLDELIGKLTTTRETLATAFSDGESISRSGNPTPTVAGLPKPTAAPVAPPSASPKPKRAYKRRDAAPAKAARPSNMTGGSVGAALRVVLPTFGKAWFTVEETRAKIREACPDVAEEKMNNVSVQLLGMIQRGRLESQGTGLSRQYRVLNLAGLEPSDQGAKPGESYDERKTRLGL